MILTAVVVETKDEGRGKGPYQAVQWNNGRWDRLFGITTQVKPYTTYNVEYKQNGNYQNVASVVPEPNNAPAGPPPPSRETLNREEYMVINTILKAASEVAGRTAQNPTVVMDKAAILDLFGSCIDTAFSKIKTRIP